MLGSLAKKTSVSATSVGTAVVKTALIALVLIAATDAKAQSHRGRSAETQPAPTVSIEGRDSVVTARGPFKGRTYWLALAQCGGIYFKLNVLYTDAAVQVRVVKPDVRANERLTRKLNEAIDIATTYFDAAQRFLMTDRGISRDAAILTYDGASQAAGERVITIGEGLAAANACPALYRACRRAYPKACREPLASLR